MTELLFPGRIVTTSLNGFQEAYLYDRGWSPAWNPETEKIERYAKAGIALSWEPLIFGTIVLDPPGLWTLTAECTYVELMLALAEWYEALHIQQSTLPGQIWDEFDLKKFWHKHTNMFRFWPQ